MDKASGRLTVFFEEPFWVGVFERISDGRLSACKVTFGGEPADGEVWEFVLRHYDRLRFSPAVEAPPGKSYDNPKRRQREAGKQLRRPAVGTKAQQALQMQHEALKTQRKQLSREQREAEKQRQFDLKQQKRKQKHRGR